MCIFSLDQFANTVLYIRIILITKIRTQIFSCCAIQFQQTLHSLDDSIWTMPIIKEKKLKTRTKSTDQIRKKAPNPCEMEPFHQFGSCSSTSDSISSSNSEDEEMPRTRTNRFQSFQPYYRGKRKTYVRSTSKMNLSRR